MLICVVVMFLLCWGPRFIMEFLIKMQFDWIYQGHVFVIRTYIFLLPMIHAILNPVVYFIMSRNFRQSVVTKCSQACCRRPREGSFEDLALHPRTSHIRNSTILVHHNHVKVNKPLKELVVVHVNGEVAEDLIETAT